MLLGRVIWEQLRPDSLRASYLHMATNSALNPKPRLEGLRVVGLGCFLFGKIKAIILGVPIIRIIVYCGRERERYIYIYIHVY